MCHFESGCLSTEPVFSHVSRAAAAVLNFFKTTWVEPDGESLKMMSFMGHPQMYYITYYITCYITAYYACYIRLT